MELWVTHNEFEANLPARCVDMDDFKGACELFGLRVFSVSQNTYYCYFYQYHVI